MENPLAQFSHPAWLTAVLTAVGYGVVLATLFVVMFVAPLAIFTSLL